MSDLEIVSRILQNAMLAANGVPCRVICHNDAQAIRVIALVKQALAPIFGAPRGA